MIWSTMTALISAQKRLDSLLVVQNRPPEMAPGTAAYCHRGKPR